MKKALCLLCTLVMLLGVLVVPVAVYAEDDVYTLSDLAFIDLNLNVLETPPQGSCMVRVYVTKNQAREAEDFVVLMAYDDEGRLLSFSFMNGAIVEQKKTQFGTKIYVPEGEQLGYVKACVWDNISSMTPLSNVLKLSADGSTTPEETPGENPGEEPEQTETLTLQGYLSGNNRTDPTQYAGDEIAFTVTSGSGEYIAGETYRFKTDLTGIYHWLCIDATAELRLNVEENQYYLTAITPNEECFVAITAEQVNEYSLDEENLRLFVNGTECVGFSQGDYEQFVLDESIGTVILADSAYDNDDNYDMIFVNYFATGRVDSINESKQRIIFRDIIGVGVTPSLYLDTEINDRLVYHIYMDGAPIAFSDIQEGDILSIAYDVTNGFDSSDFYEIYVSRKTAEGQYTEPNPDTETIVVGNGTYAFVGGYAYEVNYNLNLGDTYLLYLDMFGRIFDYELTDTFVKYAIIEKYTKSSADDYYRVQLYTFDGEIIYEQVDTTRVKFGSTGYVTAYDINEAIGEYVYGEGDAQERIDKEPIQNRVVTYRISPTTGNIVYLEPAPIEKSAMDSTFRQSTWSVGAVKMSNRTKIIDATEYVVDSNPNISLLSGMTIPMFQKDTDYSVYAYGDKLSDNTYPYAIVTYKGAIYNQNTNFAVLTASAVGCIIDGDYGYKFTMLHQGESVTLYAADDVVCMGVSDPTDLQQGDVIVFDLDTKGRMKRLDVLISADAMEFSNGAEAVRSVAENGMAQSDIDIPQWYASNWTSSWSSYTDDEYINPSKDISRFLYGPIVDRYGSFMTLGTYASGEVDGYSGLYTNVYNTIDSTGEYGDSKKMYLTDETYVYIYDGTKKEQERISCGTLSDIKKSEIEESEKISGGEIIPWENIGSENAIYYAFVKAVEDEITDILFIDMY